MVRKVIKMVFIPLICMLALCFPIKSEAATFSRDTIYNQSPWSGGSYSVDAVVFGYNQTHGIIKLLETTITTFDNRAYSRINYTVPDDGSTWIVTGAIIAYEWRTSVIDGDSEKMLNRVLKTSFQDTHTTGGSFTGASPKTATDAANSASVAANQARTSANTAATAAAEARDVANSINTKVDNVQSSISNINTAVTNISNNLSGDVTPPTVKLRTVSGSNATSGNLIQAVMDVSDNISSVFTYSLDATVYQPIPENKIITLSVNQPGQNVISVWVKDEAGNVGTTSIIIRKI